MASHAGPSRSYSEYSDGKPTVLNDDGEDLFDPGSIDPELRLRTTQTAHSVIAESIRLEHAQEKRKRRRLFSTFRRNRTPSKSISIMGSIKEQRSRAGTIVGSSDFGQSLVEASASTSTAVTAAVPALPAPATKEKPSLAQRIFNTAQGKSNKTVERRSIHVNIPLPPSAVYKGEPIVRYVRNKVRTAKYTIITFLPRNLFEQFRRVANIYFLGLVVLQLFSIFGAPNGQIGMLPLLAILGMTAIKDAIEDWRRARQDDEVNNAATTKLGGWRNVNQPTDSREWYEKLFRPAPGKPSKGVQKLRQKEAAAATQIVLDSVPTKSTPDMYRAESRASGTSKRSVGVMDWSTHTPGTANWERTLWKKLEVGDLVLLRENEQVPADIIVLSTSNADHLCFVETKNLDGETNLKVRKALKATCSMNTEEDLEHAHFIVDSEAPHANLYSYNGVLKYRSDKEDWRQEAITINELLLRGCSLRNTKWVIGMVAFTGADTKIMLNGGDTPSKRSKIERETNFNVIMNFVLLMVLCLVTAILHGWYQTQTNTSAQYFEQGAQVSENVVLASVVIFFSCLIVFQNIVPISLYITIEIVKTVQAFFIFQDVEMYYDVYDTPCVPKSWNVSDDLGQIEYVFSDKTGTLTQNIMEFKKCSIQGVSFGEGVTEAMMGAAKRDGVEGPADVDIDAEKAKMVETMRMGIDNRYLRQDKLTLIAPDLATRMVNKDDPLRPHIIDFFRALAVCHTVLADAEEEFVLEYKAESPDEAALVAAARDVGFPFVNRNTDRIEIEVLGQPETWRPLRVLEFNSSRKRMSVIARSPSGQIVLFCKGADSVIYERLAKDHDAALKETTLKDLETFANGGLRTLCIASRELSESEFTEWAQTYDAACAAVQDRETEIEKACEYIEHSLHIIGATALEDKLQEGVPDAIATLHQAGIKLWILTGDKLQTAIEIGYSCNLLTNDMEVMIISTDSEAGARAQIEAGLNKIVSMTHNVATPPTFAVVIDGESLRYALGDELKGLFLNLGTQCAAVICCRVSPSQKALVVRLVKEGCNAMTLAIGDGANDVSMIQEANIGIGLFGLEGSQAAMSADYAFGQFRFLTRLLLVHGRWSYVRIADMHANFFYKNVIWTIAMFWYLIYTSFDATYLFEYTLLLMFNLFFTSLPVAVMGIFDQDTNAQASMAFPQLYKPGIVGREYTRTRFWLYMADGLYQSAVVFFIPFLAYGAGETWSHTGQDTGGLAEFGTTVACAGVIAANAYVGVNSRYWTVITWVIIIASTALCFIWIPIYSALATTDFGGVASRTFTTFTFWATVLLTVMLCIGPRWLVKSFKSSYMPRDKDIIREAWVAGTLKDELGLQHRSKRKQKRSDKRREHNDMELGQEDGGIILDESPEFREVGTFTDRGEYVQTAQTPSRRSNQGYTYPPSPYIDSPTPSGASTPTRPPRPPSLALDPFARTQMQLQNEGFGQDSQLVRPHYSRNGSEGSGSVNTPLTGNGAITSPTSMTHSIPQKRRGSSTPSVTIAPSSHSQPQSPSEMGGGPGMGQRKISSRRGSRDQGLSTWGSVPSPRRMNSSGNQGYGQSYAAEGDGFEMVSPPTSHRGLDGNEGTTGAGGAGASGVQGDAWEQVDFSKSRGDTGHAF